MTGLCSRSGFFAPENGLTLEEWCRLLIQPWLLTLRPMSVVLAHGATLPCYPRMVGPKLPSIGAL
jgi:hypothetical protein